MAEKDYIENEKIGDFYRNLSLLEREKYTERYKVECKECDFSEEVIGGPWAVTGTVMKHHINDKNRHDVKVLDISERE